MIINKITDSNLRIFRYQVMLFSIILFSLGIQAFLFSKGFYSISADERGRTLHAYKWVIGEDQTGTSRLPFYSIMVGSVLKLWPNLFLAPRLVGSIFGFLSLVSIMWLSHEIFHNKTITFFAAFLGCIFLAASNS